MDNVLERPADRLQAFRNTAAAYAPNRRKLWPTSIQAIMDAERLPETGILQQLKNGECHAD